MPNINTIINSPQKQNINKSEEIHLSKFSLPNNYGRDVIIINPYSKGSGDKVLAKKIANIALNEGCRVTISLLDTSCEDKKNHHEKYQNYSLQYESRHQVSQLKNPLFIIAPVSIANIEQLGSHLKSICGKYNFSPKDAILIEEMDLLTRCDRKLIIYANMLEKLGFTNISINQLGFDEGAIGYIPTDERTINQVKNRFEAELNRLLDSYNMSLSSDISYHLGYISSDCYFSGSQVFIANTLCETTEDERNATFIMSLRNLEYARASELMEVITDTLASKKEGYDYPSLFSKATITVINSASGKVESSVETTGCGAKKVNIILTDRLPKNIYEDFLMLADSGMSTGDQSLSEYLTLKGKLPYYDMQPWKYPLVKAIKESGGPELSEWLAQKFVGRMPFSGKKIYSFIQNAKDTYLTSEQLIKKNNLDKEISSKIATPHIRKTIRSHMKEQI